MVRQSCLIFLSSFYHYFVVDKKCEGLYNLYLVNCDWKKHVLVNLETYINESNKDGDYLSAGERVSRRPFV